MPMSASISIIKRLKMSNGTAVLASVTGDTAYAANGYVLSSVQIGLNRLDLAVLNNDLISGDVWFAWDSSSKKIKALQHKIGVVQTETIEVTAACSSAGNIVVAITSDQLAAARSITVALTTGDDTVTKVAAKVVTAINGDAIAGVLFTASNSSGVVTITAKYPHANDSTLAMAVTLGETGVTVGSSTNGTAGVATVVEVPTGTDLSDLTVTGVFFGA
jgi:hypothetical protein